MWEMASKEFQIIMEKEKAFLKRNSDFFKKGLGVVETANCLHNEVLILLFSILGGISFNFFETNPFWKYFLEMNHIQINSFRTIVFTMILKQY